MSTDTLKHLRGLLEPPLGDHGHEGQGGAGEGQISQIITPEMIREAVPNWIGLGWMWAEHAAAVLNKKLASRVPEADVALHNAAPALLACAEALQNSLRYIDHAPECDFERTDNPHGDFCCCQYSKIRKESVAALDQLRKVTL